MDKPVDETQHLLSSPENEAHLLESIKQLDAGNTITQTLITKGN